MQKILLGLLLLGSIMGCSPQKKPDKVVTKLNSVPDKLQEVYQISKQTSYSLYDCDTTVNEIRVWKSGSRYTSTNAMFLKGHTVSTPIYYLANKNEPRLRKVIAVINSQERILDQVAEKEHPVFFKRGGPALTCRQGVEAALDSLFKLGFADMQSQPQEETLRVGDGTSYIIEVRLGIFYKYVYYQSPEYFDNAPARKFIKVYQFLTQERQYTPEFTKATQH
jgi:hypothetical protein